MTKTLKQKLEDLKSDFFGTDSQTLKDYVIGDIIESAENYQDPDNEGIKSFFQDLMRGGCASGMISELIYYKDTHAFYNRYYDYIEDLRTQHEEDFGEPLTIKGDLKNFLAWYGYEETAYKIANDDLNLDL
jgi:hypothetical protein